MLPDLDGLEVTRRLRADGIRVPVLFLTARDALEDKMAGLTVGGDDYVTKPSRLAEIVARVRAMLRRAGGDAGDEGMLRSRTSRWTRGPTRCGGRGGSIQLTATEFNLLRFFLRNPRQVLSKAQILDHVWHYDFGGEANVVETYVSYLRKKLERHGPPLIHTIRLVGYTLRESEARLGVTAAPAAAGRRRGGPRRARRCADVVTYPELRSFLYSRIDQSLEQSHMAIEAALGSGGGPLGGSVPSSDGDEPNEPIGPPPVVPSGSSTQPPSCNGFADLSDDMLHDLQPGTFVEVRSASDAILCRSLQAAPLGSSAPTDPTLPARITGFSSNAADHGEATVYFTSAGTQYRLRASVLEGGPYKGGQLVDRGPYGVDGLDPRPSGRRRAGGHRRRAPRRLVMGWWLVRVSFRPLRAVEDTAEAIARGELAERVPGDEARTEVGRLARALNTMLGRIEIAFAQRDATEEELRASEGRMRQFVADASHELRTPLTAVSAYAELFEQGRGHTGR